MPEAFRQQRLRCGVARVDESGPFGDWWMPWPIWDLLQYAGCYTLPSQTRRNGYVGDEMGWMLIVTPDASDETNGFTLNRGDELVAVAFGKDRVLPVGVHWSELAIQKGISEPLLNPNPVIS